MRRLGVVLLALSVVCLLPLQVSAIGLGVTPPEYRVTLKAGEKKKGYIDISNPLGEDVKVTTSVQGFRQVDDAGTLQFFDDEKLQAGIQLDLNEFTLGPGEAMRMYFQVDGTKLPTGDVFGSIFFATTPADNVSGVNQTVRLGTLLSITNGTPTARLAEITALKSSFWQLGDTVAGSYTVRNTADPSKTTGFYPTVTISLSPLYSSEQQTGKLVFAGRERSNDFSLEEGMPRLGFYLLKVSYGDSSQQQLVFVATGYWRYIGLALVLGVIGVGVWLVLRHRSRNGPLRSRRGMGHTRL